MIGTAAALMGAMVSTLTAGLPPHLNAANGGTQAKWLQGDVYDLKVKAVVRCNSPAGGGVYLGVELRVRSKTKSLFVAPRDANLRDGGVLFPAARELDLAGCRPALKPTQLGRAAETGGFVVFEVPTLPAKLTLEFGPTRWGGAQRLTVALPEPKHGRRR